MQSISHSTTTVASNAPMPLNRSTPSSNSFDPPSLTASFSLTPDTTDANASLAGKTNDEEGSFSTPKFSDSALPETLISKETDALLQANADSEVTDGSILSEDFLQAVNDAEEEIVKGDGDSVVTNETELQEEPVPFINQALSTPIRKSEAETSNAGTSISGANRTNSAEMPGKPVQGNPSIAAPTERLSGQDAESAEVSNVQVLKSTMSKSLTSQVTQQLESSVNHSINQRSHDAPPIQFTAKVHVDNTSPTSSMASQLNEIVKDKLDLQITTKKQSATIRLDPPDLGRVELKVKMEADKLYITVNASSNHTREAINQTVDRLRNDLAFHGEVDVNVGSLPNESRESFYAKQESDEVFDNGSEVLSDNFVSTTHELSSIELNSDNVLARI